MHNAAIRAARLDFIYVAFPIHPERFAEAARGLGAAGLVGLNCTVPHKFAALKFCDEISDEARLVQTVNTIHYRPDGTTSGTNTDVEGYIETLRNEGDFDFSGKTVVQLGAGGAGRATALGALKAGAVRLVLANRTPEKAEELAVELRPLFPDACIEAIPLTSAPDALRHAHLVTNVSSLGLHEKDPFPCDAADIPEDALVFDAAYTAQGSTAWLRAAAARGCDTLDGFGMLVRQGAASFRTWTGVAPDLDVMFDAIRRARS